MSFFLLQSAALLTLAYFLGCWFGCFVQTIDSASPVRLAGREGAARPTPAVEPVRRASVTPTIAPEKTPSEAGAGRERLKRAFDERREERRVEAPTVTRVATPAPARTPAAVVVPAAATVDVAAPASLAAAKPDDLKRIKGIGPEIERKLNALGVRRFAEIAAWASPDVERLNRELDYHGRIQHENWIEQAAILAGGGDTAFSRRVDRKDLPSSPRDIWTPVAPAQVEREGVVSAQAPPPEDKSAATALAAAAATAAVASSAAARAAAAALGSAAARAETTGGDDLTRIRGITPEIDAGLRRLGVTRFAAIARWSPTDVDGAGARLGIGGAIERENWVEQAAELARGGETEYSRRQARDARAGQSAPGSRPAGARAARVRSAEVDDLKRIRGIGIVLENKLRALGIVTYDQIAAWTPTEVEEVSVALELKERVAKENWIEQARILADGGSTEFARRVDRGEVAGDRSKT